MWLEAAAAFCIHALLISTPCSDEHLVDAVGAAARGFRESAGWGWHSPHSLCWLCSGVSALTKWGHQQMGHTPQRAPAFSKAEISAMRSATSKNIFDARKTKLHRFSGVIPERKKLFFPPHFKDTTSVFKMSKLIVKSLKNYYSLLLSVH